MKKKFLLVMLALMMIFTSFPTTVFAAELNSDEIISFEQYYSAMKAEYAKYGHTYEVLQKNEDLVFTKKLLDESLKLVNQRFSEENSVIEAKLVESNDNINANASQEFGILSVDPVVKFADFTVSNRFYYKARAGFRIEAHLTDNVISGIFISFDSCTCYQYGTYNFLKDWEIISLDYWLSSDQKSADGNIIIRATFEYNEPNTGILVGDTYDYEVSFSIPEAYNP